MCERERNIGSARYGLLLLLFIAATMGATAQNAFDLAGHRSYPGNSYISTQWTKKAKTQEIKVEKTDRNKQPLITKSAVPEQKDAWVQAREQNAQKDFYIVHMSTPLLVYLILVISFNLRLINL